MSALLLASLNDWITHPHYKYTLLLLGVIFILIWDYKKALLFRNAKKCEKYKMDLLKCGKDLAKLKKKIDELEDEIYLLELELIKEKHSKK